MSRWIKFGWTLCWPMILVISLVLCAGCYEKTEGCLDAFAENFDFEADRDCCDDKDVEECCCTYPDLFLTIQHMVADENMVLGEVYLNNRDQPYIINKVSFFMSSVQLHNDIWYPVDEVIDLIIDGQIKPVPDDVTKITRQGFEFPVGHFLTPGSYDMASMTIGISDDFRLADSASFNSSHSMYQPGNDLYSDSLGYLLYHVEMVTDTTSNDTLNFSSPAEVLADFAFPVSISKERGDDISVNILVDYGEWFDDIDFENDDVSVVNEKIRKGLENSIAPIE